MSAPLLVADSGPLIALARLDLLAVPARLFGELLVTATVWRLLPPLKPIPINERVSVIFVEKGEP